MKFIPIPEFFFSKILPEVEDILELRTTLYALQILGQSEKQFASLSEIEHLSGISLELLGQALEKAVKRGTFIHLTQEGKDVYLLNLENKGLMKEEFGKPNIFALYEENIGILTPMIAEELKDAEKTYPTSWIEDAMRQAVRSGHRKWSYIAAILERWAREGKDSGKSKRGSKTRRDPEEYLRRYGHFLK
jgi:DnaD/phage-associated family protein